MVAWSKQRPTDQHAKVLVGNLCGMAVSDPDGKLTTAERSRYTQLAIDSYVAAIEKARKPEDIAMLSNRLAKAYYDAGKPREAERFYLKCLEITPGNYVALNNLGYLYVDDLDKPEKALPYVRQVLRYRPQDANVLDTYGWVLARLKRYTEAKKYLQRAIERDPGLAAGRYHLGWVYEQTGDLKQAMKQYRLAMEAVRTKTYLPIHRSLKESIERVKKKLKNS
jgi:tetratricopeptide (TPR) repeat protein